MSRLTITTFLGRRTYETFVGYWPRVTDPANPIATALDRLPKYAASKTLQKADWKGTTLVRDAVGEVARLKGGRMEGEIQVHGSADLAQTLIQHDLVDEYNLLTFHVVLGSGKRLFGNGAVLMAFGLSAFGTTSSGICIQTYTRKGTPSERGGRPRAAGGRDGMTSRRFGGPVRAGSPGRAAASVTGCCS